MPRIDTIEIAPASGRLLFWLEIREVIPYIVFEMRRDGALIERFAGRALVLRELLLIWHQRGIGYAW